MPADPELVRDILDEFTQLCRARIHTTPDDLVAERELPAQQRLLNALADASNHATATYLNIRLIEYKLRETTEGLVTPFVPTEEMQDGTRSYSPDL